MKYSVILGKLALSLLFLSLFNSLPGQTHLASKVYHWPDSKKGAEQRLLLGQTTHLEQLEIKAVQWQAGESPAEEEMSSDLEELLIVKEGLLRITLGDQAERLGPGSVALILPGQKYSLRAGADGPTAFYRMSYRSKQPMSAERGKKAGGSFVVHWEDVAYREHDKGGRRDFFDRPTAMCADFEMHVTNLNEKVQSHPPHTHDVEEIILLVQGDIEMHIDGKTPKVKVGDFAFVDSVVPHAPTNIGKGQAIYFAFQWK